MGLQLSFNYFIRKLLIFLLQTIVKQGHNKLGLVVLAVQFFIYLFIFLYYMLSILMKLAARIVHNMRLGFGTLVLYN